MAPYVTNIRLSDGFGSQYQHIICCLLICYRSGYHFAYNPISIMEHNYENDPNFLEKIEDLMNIKSHFISRYDESLKDEPITVCDMTAKYVIDKAVDSYATDDFLGQIKTMFWANKNREVFTNGKTNVAVHIRRQNSHDNRVEGTDTSDEFFLNAIKRIKEEHSDKDLQFHIYSQGNMEQFEIYKGDDTILHIDQELCSTFIELVASDILVTSFSSLSYIAGYLTDGIVYYHPFWHPPRSKWIKL